MMNEAGKQRLDALVVGFYRRFAVHSAVTLLVLWALGYWPTMRWAPNHGMAGMLVGTAIALVASWVGTLPVYMTRYRPPLDSISAAMGAIAVRLSVALVLSLVVALSGFFSLPPLLIWVAIAHAAFLVADTTFARALMQAKNA